MSKPKIVKFYRINISKLNDRDYIVLILETEEGEEEFLLECGVLARNLAVDIMKYNSEISVRKRFSL